MFYLKSWGAGGATATTCSSTPRWTSWRLQDGSGHHLLLEVLRAYPKAQLAVVTRRRALEAPEDEGDVDAEDAG